MLESLKSKAISQIFERAAEPVVSGSEPLNALVRFSRLDSKSGGIRTDFVGLVIWIAESDLPLIGSTVTVRGTTYDVVDQDTKKLFDGTVEVHLTEPSTNTQGTWR